MTWVLTPLGKWDRAITAYKRVAVEQSYDLVDNRISLMNRLIIKLSPHIIDRYRQTDK